MNGFQESLMFDVVPVASPIILTGPERREKKRAKGMLTLARVRELFDYDPETGVLVRRITTSNRAPKGTVAGRRNGNGYLRVMIDGYTDYVHRVVWFHFYGEWPEFEMDHIDGNGMNNRISNLRCATHAQNSQNLSTRNTNKSGMIGVSWSKLHSKWEAYINVNYKKKYLGLFDDLKAAGEAYLAAKQGLHHFQPTPRGIS